MSGGSMDYAFSHIAMALEDVKSIAERVASNTSIGDFVPAEYYVKKYPKHTAFKGPSALKDAVLKRLNDAATALAVAEVYARRVEWLESDDDGFEAFVLRTDEELMKLGRKEENHD